MVVTRSYPMEGRVTAVEERMVKLEQKLGVIVEEQPVMRSGFDRLDLKMAALFKALQIPFSIDETPARRENQLLEEGDVEAPISKESGKDPRKMETHEIPAYPTSPSTGDVNMQDSKVEVPAAENGVSESADQSQMETYAKAEASKKIAPVSEVIYGALAASDLQNIPTQSIKASVGSLDCTIEINSMAGIRHILEVTYERQGGYQLKPPWPWIATTSSSIKFDPLENLEADFLAMKNTGGKFLVFQSALPSTGIGARSAREIEGRVGGGIYTKAVDVGDDLIGKIERNIPEDCSTVNTLLEYNASYSAEDKEGMTPLNLLSQGPGNQKLRDLLLQHLEEQRKQKAIDACNETKAKMDALHMVGLLCLPLICHHDYNYVGGDIAGMGFDFFGDSVGNNDNVVTWTCLPSSFNIFNFGGALLSAFVSRAGVLSVDLLIPEVFIGLIARVHLFSWQFSDELLLQFSWIRPWGQGHFEGGGIVMKQATCYLIVWALWA